MSPLLLLLATVAGAQPPATLQPDTTRAVEAALDAGAQDVETGNDGHDVSCEPDDFHDVREALEAKFTAPPVRMLGIRIIGSD